MMGNGEMRWERRKKVKVGVELRLLNERVRGRIDLYKKKRRELLLWLKIGE